jgi:hypothetical protein
MDVFVANSLCRRDSNNLSFVVYNVYVCCLLFLFIVDVSSRTKQQGSRGRGRGFVVSTSN